MAEEGKRLPKFKVGPSKPPIVQTEEYCKFIYPYVDTDRLIESGIIQGYDCILSITLIDILRSLCKYGLPTKNVFEFSAQCMEKFDKKWKAKRLKEIQERIKQKDEERKKKKDEEKLKKEAIEEETKRYKGRRANVP